MSGNQLRCPNCGTTFTIDETGYAALLTQVRDQAFSEEIASREKLMEQARESAVAAAEQQVRQQDAERMTELQTQVAELQAQLTAAQENAKMQVASVQASEQVRAAEERSKLEADLAQLREQLSNQKQQSETDKELAVARAVSQLQEERNDLASQVQLAQAQMQQMQAEQAARLAEAEKSREDLLRLKDEQIERLRDMKARQSTKMLGESLELHCETEFNKVRAIAFPRAQFGKDNEVVDGTKGDYVFREADENGVEFLSVMFEMKNEADTTATKHKNADFFSKLDADRTKKGCEYAILVSLLENDNEYYNQGIVEVTEFPKMYVIRPQFFVPMIGLLRNMALASLADRQQLVLMREREVDVANFEKKLAEFKSGFTRNMTQAEKKYLAAIDEIDKAIRALQKTRDDLVSSNKHLGQADARLENLTIRKLTWGNPTMKAKFDEAREADESADDPSNAPVAD